MYNFIEGPLVSLAFIIFFGGLIYQWLQFLKLTRKKDLILPPYAIIERRVEKTTGQRIVDILASFKGTLWKTDPLMMVVTSVFHVCLILTPIFASGHGMLLNQSWGFNFWSFPESFTDVLTIAVLICVVFFMMRRLFLVRVRAITSPYDYFVLLIAAVPFITGFLAYHKWFDYRITMTLHILSGEVMLVAIPFTKLGHMLFFFLYRFLVGGEYSFTWGGRVW